jgi:MoxR-like ATPase
MGAADLLAIQDRVLTIRVDEAIEEYILNIAEATRRSDELTVGLSPRGSLALMQAARASALLDGREYVVPDDVKALAVAVCAHRLMTRALVHDGASGGSDDMFRKILETIPVPQ